MENEIYTEKARLEPIVKDHMDRIDAISKRVCKEHGLASMSVCCVTDLLDKGAFVGGVTVAFHGTSRNKFEMLYQLVKVCYDDLIEDTSNKGYAEMLWNSFSKQVVARKEHFQFGWSEFAEELLKEIGKKFGEDSDEDNE